jgi:hypothetical protein
MRIQGEDIRIIFLFLILPVIFFTSGCSAPEERTDFESAGRQPVIYPDFSGTVIPPNIAPLNFFIKEGGEDYVVRIHSKEGVPIRIQNGSGSIRIPENQWKQMLSENAGGQLVFDIFMKNKSGRWLHFDSVVNRIADEKIDSYAAYRKFGPLFNQWKKMGIYQRCLENFDEDPILFNQLTMYENCMNCHNFWQNETKRWILHMRFGPGTSMLLTMDGKTRKINTRTKFNKSPGGYPAWHPSGELIAFSVGAPLQFFHTIGETRDELDRALDIIVYDVQKNMVTTVPQISSKERVEVWPAWTPDGKYLYFCSAPRVEAFYEKSRTGEDTLLFDKIHYDLMRIPYNRQSEKWGELETVISSKDFGLSVLEPKISPDGRFLAFTATRYGSFPMFHSDADLYMLDLATGHIKRLTLNTGRAEGYHSWSSNSRWLIFASKREDGQFTRLYISHIDSSGNSSKAFIMPQEDPLFYDSYLEIYNVPEFIKEPVSVSPQSLADAAYTDAIPASLDTNVINGMKSTAANTGKKNRAFQK